ncbi:MAG: hypothetical protein QM594_08245 [Niabella sp.]
MKKMITLFSALLIVLGLKAQKPVVQKETVKPVESTSKTISNKQETIKGGFIKNVNSKDATIKDANLKEATIKNAASKEIKKAGTKQ